MALKKPGMRAQSAAGSSHPRTLDELKQVLSERLAIPTPTSRTSEDDLALRTDDFNNASEEYWASYPYPEYIRAKPFSDPGQLPRYLFNLGVLFQGLRLSPGDVVGELGAGSCWVSHFLNLFGCRTISVDVSKTAVELGREVFLSSARTRWELEPQFVSYDGRTLPLADNTCDRWIVHDAFHHIPNQRRILCEMARTLRPGSIVGMVEPGRGHSSTEASRSESDKGMLENDIIVEDLALLARECGFSRTTIMPLTLQGTREIEAESLLGFLRGEGLVEHWIDVARALLDSHFIFLYNGGLIFSSRQSTGLRARIETPSLATDPLKAVVGQPVSLVCRIRNVGEARWIGTVPRPGIVNVGGHLFREGDEQCLDWDWLRADLGHDVEPDQEIEVTITLPGVAKSGRYRVELDLVAEDVAWFAAGGSVPLSIQVAVSDEPTFG